MANARSKARTVPVEVTVNIVAGQHGRGHCFSVFLFARPRPLDDWLAELGIAARVDEDAGSHAIVPASQ